MKVKIKKLRDNATIPSRGSNYAAGYDLYACLKENEIYAIEPHQTIKVGTGVAIQLPPHTFGAIFARSGLATKQGLRPANCVGVCDEDYTGEYIVALHNDTDEVKYIENGERIAQLVVLEYTPIEFALVDELDSTERGDGGFGSTGAK